MALLAADDGFALEVRHLSYWPDEEQSWLNYEFRFLYRGQPLFDPAAFDQSPLWGIRWPAGFSTHDLLDYDSILSVVDDALGANQYPTWDLDTFDAELDFTRWDQCGNQLLHPPGVDHWLVVAWVWPRELHCGSNSSGPEFQLIVSREQLQRFRDELAAEWAALEPAVGPGDD